VSRLPRVSGRECVAALGKLGFYVRRRESSHLILRREDPFCQVVVPDHRERDRDTLHGVLKRAGVTADEFVVLL